MLLMVNIIPLNLAMFQILVMDQHWFLNLVLQSLFLVKGTFTVTNGPDADIDGTLSNNC